jgi:SPP1 gp7 family putative phage head morphogenesis protein
MPKPDPAHKETDKILRDMEKRLDEVYKQAYKEARQTADDFMKSFREMDKKKRQQVKDGELDKAEYDRWRRTQVFQGNRYHQMADTLAADMTHTNQIAASVINGYLPEVYAVNHNYGTYEVEKDSRINTQYTMYDKQTVERLMRDNPDLLPRKAAVNVPKDELWNKKHINSAITQGILQGESIDKIAQRLAATVTDMSHTSAIRNARTMTTSAQNGGRIDSYKRAESMGIKMLQVWMATLDSRTRHEHRLLDGQKRKVGEAFEVEGEKIFFPGDPAADPALVYNCRCTLVGEVEGVDYNLSDVSQRDNKLGDMTYEEWKEEKRKQDDAEPPAPKNEPKPKAEDKPAEVEVPAPTVEKPDAVDEPIKPQFTPARTKEETVEYAQRFADNVNLDGVSRSNANKINKTLTELTEKYPIKKLDKITGKERKAAMSAAYDTLNINGNSLGKLLDEAEKNFIRMQESNGLSIDMINMHWQGKVKPPYIQRQIKQLENELKFKRWAVFSSYDDKVKVSVIHEYGHIIADQYFGQINDKMANPNYTTNPKIREMRQKWDNVFQKAIDTGDIYSLSRYGRSNSHEFFAESFAAREMGEKLPDYVESLMKEVLDNGIM